MRFAPFLLFPWLLVSCGRHPVAGPDGPARPSVAVQVQTAGLSPHVSVEEVVGTVRAKLRSMVEAKVNGRVLEVLATPGTRVKAGQLLVRLDGQELQARADQARAVLAQANRDWERQKQLLGTGAGTRQDFDTAEARVQVSQAGLTEAETMRSYHQVTAPFDGIITRKYVDLGDLALPGKPLLEIEAPTPLRFEADLPEALLDRVQLGASMAVRVASVPTPLEGIVSELAPVAEAASHTFLLKLDLPPREGLRGGQFGRVSVPILETKVLLVPPQAVLKRGQMELVFVVHDGKATLRLVRTGKTLSSGVELLAGVAVGETLVISDVSSLSDGQPVTIRP